MAVSAQYRESVLTIQKVTSGAFRFSRSNDDTKKRISVAGSMVITVDDNAEIIADFRVHDGSTGGGLSVPPPGTVCHMLTKKLVTYPYFEIPDGWLFCDGTILEKSVYNALYTAIGDTYNNDQNLTTDQFQIPDYRGYFLRCTSDPSVSGISGYQGDSVVKHSHFIELEDNGGHSHYYTGWDNSGTLRQSTTVFRSRSFHNSGYDGFNNPVPQSVSSNIILGGRVSETANTNVHNHDISVLPSSVTDTNNNEVRPINITFPTLIKY